MICVVVNQVTGENCVSDLTRVAINNLTSAVQELLAKSPVNCPTSGRDSRDTYSITEQMPLVSTQQPSSQSPVNERKCNIREINSLTASIDEQIAKLSDQIEAYIESLI